MSTELATIVKTLEAREHLREAVLTELFDKQREIYDDPRGFIACHHGRRFGKSECVPRFAVIGAMDAGFKETVLLCAETKQKARALYWADLLALLHRHKLTDWHVNAAESIITTPWKSTIVLWGASDLQAVNLIRGFKLKLVLADEVATWGSQHTAGLLESFVYDVCEPALGDVNGRMMLLGTPSITRIGTWFEICEGFRPGWSVHKGDVRQNPKFPRDPMEFLEEVLDRNGWDWTTATFRREYLGEFVNDEEAQVYKYAPERNLAEMPEDYDVDRWVHTLGVDFGLRDECAWTVIASHPHEKDIWVIHSHKTADLLPDEASRVTEALVGKYHPDVLVGDSGGMGVSYVEHWNRRFDAGLQMVAALKKDKRGMIDLMNGELMSGRMRLVMGKTVPLQEEFATLPWAADGLTANKMFAAHCSDSCLYAYRHHQSYLHEHPVRRVFRGPSDPDSDEALEALEARHRDREDSDFWETDDYDAG